MAYKSIFGEEIKPATTPKASTGYVSIFDNEEKKLEPIATQDVPVKINPLVPEVKSTSVTDYLFKELSPKTTTTVSNRYVQDPTRSNVSIPFEQADSKTQYESLTYDEIKKMKSSELVDLRRKAGIDKGDSKEWYSSFMAGIGDIMTTVGSTMKWKGAEGGLIDRIGENIQEAGKITQSKYTDYEALDKLGEFDWADLKDVSFWQNKAPRMLPFTMSLIPAAIIGGSLGATASASFGLGALASTITGAVGGALLSRPLEGMMEAGSTYDEAIAKGFSEEKAQKAANQVFIENLKQMSVLDVIQMIPLLKGIKGFEIPNSTLNKIVNIGGTGTAIVSEGFEEVLQNKIVANALGEKFDLASPETKESFVLGTIMGGVFQGSGGIVNISQRAIANATKENLSKKNQAIFEKNLDKFMKEGETRSDSEALALNEVAKIDQKGLQDAITKTLDEKAQELKEAGIEQQASTVLKEETPADKLAKQIKKSDPIDRLLATIEEQEVETKEEEPLVQEARKYKSAEEFVDSQIFAKDSKLPTEDISGFTKTLNKSEQQIFQRLNEIKLKMKGLNPDDRYKPYKLTGDEKSFYKEHSGQFNKKLNDYISDAKSVKSQLTEIWNKAQEKPTVKKETPTIKKPTLEKADVIEEQDITTLESEISNKYKTKENAEEKLYEIYTEFEIAEAGERFMTDDGNFIGKSSSFPQWIPEKYRSRKAFNSIMDGIKDINNIKYPDKNKTAQRDLYDLILEELDRRLGVNTSDIRNKILNQYESNKEEKVSRTISKSSKRTIRSKSAKKRKEVKQKDIFGKKVEPERKPAEQEGLGLNPEKDVMAKKIRPSVSSEDYIKAKSEELKSKAEGQVDIFTKDEDLPMFQEYILSGIEVAKEAEEMGSDQGGLSDYTLDQIKSEDYSIKEISIEELRKSDPDLDDYLKTAEVREYEGEPFAMYPIVSSKGEVLDGYNRIAQSLEDGEKTINVFYGIDNTKYQELSNEDALIKEYIRSDFTEDIVARERFNIPKLEKISFGGSDRDVYNLGDKYVLKVAKTARGLAQNRLEGEPFAPVPKEIERGANYVVVEKAEKPNKATKELVKRLNENKSSTFGRDVRMDAVDMINKTAEQYFNEGNDDMGNIIQDFNNYEIMINDITSIRNWGTIDGDPVLVDAGTLDNRLLDEYEGVKNLEDEEFREIYYKSKEAKKKYGDIDTKAKYQELGESKKLPDIQLKKDVITKDMQGNRITLSEGDVFFVYELPKSRYLLEGKESYTIPKNQFQNIKGQSIVAEKKEFAPELKETEDIIKGAKDYAKAIEAGDEDAYNELPKNVRNIIEKYSGEEGDYVTNNKMIAELNKVGYTADYGLSGEIDSFYKLGEEDPVKFEQYTLPGGKNYREILVQAKKSPARIIIEKKESLDTDIKNIKGEIEIAIRNKGYTYIQDRGGMTKKGLSTFIKERKKDLARKENELNVLTESEEYQKYKDVKVAKSDYYYRPHWEEPNVLFHIRMNERKHNGNKVSFMEEFQSDWAREGRDKGFSKNLPKGTENDIEIKFVKSNVPEGHDPKNYPGYYEAFDKRTGDFLGRGGTKPDLMERALEEINLTKGVPYNPLLKNWQVTSIKRALIEAVNTNADYFAWTNGEQQKARYDLSNEVDNIGWNKSQGWETSHKNIVVKAKKIEKSITIAIDEKGIIVSAPADQGLLGKKLNEFLGKGLAEKIMEKEEGSLSGEGLNIGGEWANSLYDIQAKKIVEQLTGGKVEIIDLGLPIDKESNTAGWRIFGKGEDGTALMLDDKNAYKKLKVGDEIGPSDATDWIVTDVLGDGKFKAVPKEQLYKKDSVGTALIADGTYKPLKVGDTEFYIAREKLDKETFDISQKTALQPALKLTPEIKAIIKGEAPQLKVEQKLYQTPSQGSQVLVETIQRITTQEALAQAQDFAIVRDTNIPIRAVEKIIENPRAFGKYYKGTIDFIYNPDITTIPHEIGHYWFEAMLTKDQQTEVLREYKEWFIKNKPNKARPDTRNGWEEAMVQDMAKYYSKKYTKKKGKIERFWDWFIYQIKRVLNKNDFIARFTYDVRTKSIDRNVSKRKLADSLNQTGAIRTSGGIIIPDETKGQAFRRKIQDINTRLDTTVRTLREGGVVIPESQDIFLAKTLLPRRIGGATEKFANEVMNPLINAMAKDGIDLDNLNLYLHAMHASERNRKMNELRKAENDKRNRQRVNPKPYFPVDGLSGMTDAEARSVINTFKEMGIASKLEEHRISLQKISKATLLFQLKEGLLSQEEYDAIRGSYENYVPISRDIEDNAKGWGTGKGVNVKGKEIKRARGSQELPVLPIVSQIFNRMNTAIVRAEKNRVAISVARLIKANPNIKTKTGKELWTIKSEKYIPRYDSFGEVEYVEPLGARSQKPNEIAFKYKGKQKYLVINDSLLVRALTEEGKSKPIPYLTRYTSLLSRLATQYNPEFLIRNFSRDISESLVNVSGIAENYLTKEQTKGLKSDILKSIPKLFGAIYGYKSRKESHGAKELIDEFVKNGGEVGYFWLEDEKTLDQKFKRQWRKSAPAGLSDKAKNKMSDFMDFVGNVNSTVELVTRVAVYKALRERGISAKQSAQIAGDITVDFNKKGEWGSLISSMYMFFNAAIQGAARVFRSIKTSKKVRVMTASLFIGGFLNGIISQLWGDGDDEDYDQFIPDYKKNTRIVFADPTGKEWTVFFLPYGFGFFWAAGRSFSEVVRGKKDILESAENVTRAFVQSFLPIDVMGGWKEFVPSSVKPLVEVATNEAWYDAPIAPDQPAYQPKIPESQRYFKTASNMSKSLSTWLNSVTGGDENRSGIVDISPEFIDYLWQQYTSGAGSFIGNVAETGYGLAKRDVKKERVPFVRSFAADVKKESVIKSNVYDIIDEGARREFSQEKKDKFYKQVDWLIKNGSLSEDEQENIDKGNELKLNFLKGQYNFTLSDKMSILEALEKMSDKDVEMFYESLTTKQIKSIRTGK